MTNLYSLAESAAAATAQMASFRRLMTAALGIEALLGLALLVLPTSVGGALALDGAAAPLAGAFLIWAALFQAPSLRDPSAVRLPIVIGVVGRFGLALAFLCVGAYAIAAVLALLAVVLAIRYHAMVRAVLMSRP